MANNIKPDIIRGEPTCSGEACPESAPWERQIVQCALLGHGSSNQVWIGAPCIPGLRRQLDEARRELCKLIGDRDWEDYSDPIIEPNPDFKFRDTEVAAARGWGYLYEEEAKED